MTRNTDKMSTEKIWVTATQDLGFFDGTLEYIKREVDNLIAKYGQDAVLNPQSDYEGYYGNYVVYWRLETDEEYERRLKKIAGYKEAAIKRAAKAEERKKQKEEAERALYEQLKVKFGG